MYLSDGSAETNVGAVTRRQRMQTKVREEYKTICLLAYLILQRLMLVRWPGHNEIKEMTEQGEMNKANRDISQSVRSDEL